MSDVFRTRRLGSRTDMTMTRSVYAEPCAGRQKRLPIGAQVRCRYREAIYEGVVADHDPIRKTTCVRIPGGSYVHPASKDVEVLP